MSEPKPENKRARFAIDITPLKKYPDFRNLWASGLITYLGSMITYVAVPFQIKEMTNSYIAVGISGLVEIVPLILFGLAYMWQWEHRFFSGVFGFLCIDQ